MEKAGRTRQEKNKDNNTLFITIVYKFENIPVTNILLYKKEKNRSLGVRIKPT